jgi:hypothetical protein
MRTHQRRCVASRTRPPRLNQHIAATAPTGLLSIAAGELHTLPLHAAAAALPERNVRTRMLDRVPVSAIHAAVGTFQPSAVLIWAQRDEPTDSNLLTNSAQPPRSAMPPVPAGQACSSRRRSSVLTTSPTSPTSPTRLILGLVDPISLRRPKRPLKTVERLRRSSTRYQARTLPGLCRRPADR